MNKKGYTLAEALITLGIIGIIAALVVPAANKARPNENKIKFLQTYDAIETQIKNFAANSRYFPTCQDFNDGNGTRCFPDNPLYNTSSGVIDPNTGHGILFGIMRQNDISNNKLCYLLADAMGTQAQVNGNVCTFTTPNGVSFAMGVQQEFRQNDRPFMVTNIIFDVEGRDFDGIATINMNNLIANNTFQRQSIRNARTFALYVFSDGNIIPGTVDTAYYLITRKDSRVPDISDGDISDIARREYGQSYGANIGIYIAIGDARLRPNCHFSN